MKIVTRGDPVPQLGLNPPPSLKSEDIQGLQCTKSRPSPPIQPPPTEKQIHTKRHTVRNIITIDLQGT